MRKIEDVDTDNPEAVAEFIYHGQTEFYGPPRLQSDGWTLTACHDNQELAIDITPAGRVGSSIRPGRLGWSIRLWDNTLRAEGGWSIGDRDGAETDIELIQEMLRQMTDSFEARVKKFGEDDECEHIYPDDIYITDTSTSALTDTLREWLSDNSITEGSWLLVAMDGADEFAESDMIVLPETR